MGSYRLNIHEMHENFVRMVETPLKERTFELESLSNDWISFKEAILDEYALEDAGQTSRKGFFDWTTNEDRACIKMETKDVLNTKKSSEVRKKMIITKYKRKGKLETEARTKG